MRQTNIEKNIFLLQFHYNKWKNHVKKKYFV